MRLIEFLISESKKGWEWPDSIVNATSTKGSRDVNFYFDYACPPNLSNTLIAPTPFSSSELVSREQYEAELAASKTEWDGEGLPPVGCRVEANYGGEWVEATVAYTDRPESHGDAVAWNEVLVFDCKTTRPFWADEFRHIRSEAERKRDEAVKEFVRQLIECVDHHAMDKNQDAIVREKLYVMLQTLPGITVID
ncbi:TPA: hypothetical protein ACXGFD_002846 [Enterobacter cloacae]